MKNNVHIISLNEKNLMKQILILTIILSILFVSINFYIHPGFSFNIIRLLLGIVTYIIVSLLLVVVNEVFHFIGYRYRCKVALESLSLAFNLEKGLIYATTTEKIKNAHYQSVFYRSFALTGILPLAIAFSSGSYPLLLASASFIAGGLGNFIGMFKLKKFPDNLFVKDVPEEFSIYVYMDKKNES